MIFVSWLLLGWREWQVHRNVDNFSFVLLSLFEGMCQRQDKNNVLGARGGNYLVANVDAGSSMRTEPGCLGNKSWVHARADGFLSNGCPNSAVGVSR